MELVRRFGGYTLVFAICESERVVTDLDTGLEDRTYNDEPLSCDKCTPYVEAALQACDAMAEQRDQALAERDALQVQNDQLRARRTG